MLDFLFGGGTSDIDVGNWFCGVKEPEYPPMNLAYPTRYTHKLIQILGSNYYGLASKNS